MLSTVSQFKTGFNMLFKFTFVWNKFPKYMFDSSVC